jgi:hypothetical protein
MVIRGDTGMTVPPPQVAEVKNPQKVWADVSSFDGGSNVLANLKDNLDRLEELHSRLQFMLGEIRGLIRK